MAKPQKVPGYQYLFRRGAVLVFRRAVPAYALPFFGKGEEHVSFDTGDLKIALPLWAEEVSKFNAKLLRAKAQRAKSLGLPTPRRVPSNVEIEEAVRKSLAERLGRNEADHIFDAADDVVEDFKVQLARQGEDVDEGLKRTGSGPSTTTIWMAEALIDEHDWDVRSDTSSYRYLIRIVGRAQREARDRLIQLIDNQPVRVVDDTFSPEQYRLDLERARHRQSVVVVSIFDMFDGYVSERKPAPRTVRAWRRQLSHFVTFIGHENAAQITAQDVQEWKESLLSAVLPNGGKRATPGP